MILLPILHPVVVEVVQEQARVHVVERARLERLVECQGIGLSERDRSCAVAVGLDVIPRELKRRLVHIDAGDPQIKPARPRPPDSLQRQVRGARADIQQRHRPIGGPAGGPAIEVLA